MIGYSKGRRILGYSLYWKDPNQQTSTFYVVFAMSDEASTSAILRKPWDFDVCKATNFLNEHAGSSSQCFPEIDIKSLMPFRRLDRMRTFIDIEQTQHFVKEYLKQSKANARTAKTREKMEKKKAEKLSENCPVKPKNASKKILKPKEKSDLVKKPAKRSTSSKPIVKPMSTKRKAKK